MMSGIPQDRDELLAWYEMCEAIAGTVVETGESNGLKTMIRVGGMAAFCGYVEVPEGHPWHGRYYDECLARCGTQFCDHSLESTVDVHGGVTFTGRFDDDGPWLIGFDCAHYDSDNSIEFARANVELLASQVAASRG
jgi:hypothetical protein